MKHTTQNTEHALQVCQSHRIHLSGSEPQNTPVRVRATEYTCRCQTSEYTCHCQKPPIHVRTHPVSVRPQNTPVSIITQNTLASVITQNTPVRTQLLVPDIAQNIFVSSVSIRKKNISSKIFQCQTKKNKSVRLSVTQNQEHTYQASPHQRELRTHPLGLSMSIRTNNTPIRPVSVRQNQQHTCQHQTEPTLHHQTEQTMHPLGVSVSVTQKPHLSCICVSLQTVDCNSQGFVCGWVWSDSAAAFDAVLATRQFVGGIVCSQLLVDSA